MTNITVYIRTPIFSKIPLYKQSSAAAVNMILLLAMPINSLNMESYTMSLTVIKLIWAAYRTSAFHIAK